jgi:hypothetical protein
VNFAIRGHSALEIVARRKSSFALSRFLHGKLAVISVGVAAALVTSGSDYAQGQSPSLGKRSEMRRALPATKFYDTPHPLPAGKPGELIRSESFEEYELPLSVSAVRILYHSRSAAGEDVAASGVVLIPTEKKPPAGGWPVIAWAHGATGVARSCAPSLARNLGHGPFLSMYVNLGYAVVAPDYIGLGTDFRNAFLDNPSNAADLIASIPASRTAVPQLGVKWIVMGEAEGGLAAVAVAEKENEIRDPGYLGAIAISGLADIGEIYGHAAFGSSGPTWVSLAYGIKTVYPRFEVSGMLTTKALAVYRDIGQTCSKTGTMAELSFAEAVKAGWDDNEFVRQYFARNSLARTQSYGPKSSGSKLYGPIMVISADSDQAVPVAATAQAIARLCKQGDAIQWQRYPSLDPGRVIGDSVRDQIAWIEARFAGRPSVTNCP